MEPASECVCLWGGGGLLYQKVDFFPTEKKTAKIFIPSKTEVVDQNFSSALQKCLHFSPFWFW